MSGELSILNCRAGDIRIPLDEAKPIELAKAKQQVTDMLKRGYLLAIEIDGILQPVKSFDAETGEYIVEELVPSDEGEAVYEPVELPKKVRPKGKTTKKRVPMTSVKATGIPPTGGG